MLKLIDPRPIADALPSIENDPDLHRRSTSAFMLGGCRGNCQQGRRACTCHSLTLADLEQAERDAPIPAPSIWSTMPLPSDRYRDPDPVHAEAPAPDAEPTAASAPPKRPGALRRAIDAAFWRGFGCGVVVFVMVLLSLIAAGVLTQWAEDHSLIQRRSNTPQPVEPTRPMTYLAGPPILELRA